MYSPEIKGWEFSWLAGATGVAGRRGVACNQQLQPIEIPTLYFRRICRAGVFDWAARCGLGINPLCPKISPTTGLSLYITLIFTNALIKGVE